VGNDDQFQRFCHAAGLAQVLTDRRFLTNAERVRNYDALHAIVEAALAGDTATGWAARLREAGVPCGAVRSIEEALTDPQILARAMVESVDHPSIGPLHVLGVPVKLSETPGEIRLPPPRLGEHTAAVLRADLGYDDARIEELVSSGAVGVLRT
jgi:crotonobetainyl-CoA:carnitine CoA-transferase CaiB-like acyl-CoA transferase